MAISASAVKELRDKTGAGMMDCKKALSETDGDFEKAVDWLRKKGIASAAKKAGRDAKEGAISSYLHGDGKIGVMVEISCETDFVARTDQFKAFSKDIAMHIAAASPQWLSSEDVPGDIIAREKEIIRDQMKSQGKPDNVIEKISEGKIKKFCEESCLMNQKFVKDTDKTIEQILQETIGQLGENMKIRRFTRYVLGES